MYPPTLQLLLLSFDWPAVVLSPNLLNLGHLPFHYTHVYLCIMYVDVFLHLENQQLVGMGSSNNTNLVLYI